MVDLKALGFAGGWSLIGSHGEGLGPRSVPRQPQGAACGCRPFRQARRADLVDA